MKDAILSIIYLLIILAIIFLERKSPAEAIMWVLVVTCLPYAGLILYLVFGSTAAIKITAAVRAKRLKSQLQIPQHQQPATIRNFCTSEEDREVIRFNENYNGSRLTSLEDIKLLTSGEAHYRSLFKDIKEAKECIYIEFYTIHHDLMGEALVKALTEKAQQGLKVIVMCDYLANISTPKKMFRPLINAGGEVIRIKPYLTHYRSHRKIVAIDHKISYIGGMNIGKQYANLHEKKTPWRDTQVRITGAATLNLENYLLTDWLTAVPRKRWKESLSYIETLKRRDIPHSKKLCQFIIGGVDNNKEGAKMCYLSMIRSAKKRIRIQTPYFIPDASTLDALKTAAAAGVQIELMIPGISASFFLDPITNYYAGQLMEYGAKVYRYKGYIHAKTMTVDDELCCIGSVNMDMRSLQVDDEVCGVFYENSFAESYNRIFDEDITHCTEFKWEDYKNRSTFDRFKESIFLPFAPLM